MLFGLTLCHHLHQLDTTPTGPPAPQGQLHGAHPHKTSKSPGPAARGPRPHGAFKSHRASCTKLHRAPKPHRDSHMGSLNPTVLLNSTEPAAMGPKPHKGSLKHTEPAARGLKPHRAL